MNLTPINFLATPAALCLLVPILALIGFLIYSGVAYGQETRAEGSKDARVKAAFDGAKLNNMNGMDFRAYVARLLEHRGYAVELPPPGDRYDDLSMDIIACKDGVRTLVLAARFNKPITLPLVSQAGADKARNRCDGAMIVTTSTFRDDSRALAASTGCALVGRDELAEWVLAYQPQLEGLL